MGFSGGKRDRAFCMYSRSAKFKLMTHHPSVRDARLTDTRRAQKSKN
jgi:hypothetical protein